jgi:NAD(P)-dependent dehydrogenase (short-subunit alcohol dehydrogenase family)
MSLQGHSVVVVGGSSGLGAAAAERFARDGAEVVVVGRDGARTEAVAGRIGARAEVVDLRDPGAVQGLFARLGPIDDLVVTVTGRDGAGPFATLDLAALRRGIEDKVLTQLAIVQAALPTLAERGSITLITAASARAALPGTVGLAAINGALEAAVRPLAAELAPRRVNAISPGVVATAWWDGFGDAAREAVFAQARETLPVGRVGTPEELGDLIVAVAGAAFMTGAVVPCDGGLSLATGARMPSRV